MKIKLYLSILVLVAMCGVNNTDAQTNKSLSNLTSPTAINQHLLPDVTNSKDLGSNAKVWRDLYLSNYLYLNKNISLHASGSGNIFSGAFSGNTNLTGTNNTGSGVYALNKLTTGYNNTATGYSALYSNTSGYDNVATGRIALYNNTTGSYNVATGTWALNNNTTGSRNTAYGYSALWQNKTGNDNTAIGKYSMYTNSSGYSNVAIGTGTLFKNVSGFNLVAIGDSALYNYNHNDYYGGSNTALGSKTLFSTTTGVKNTAIGSQALYQNTTGSYNTATGFALTSVKTGSYNTANGFTALNAGEGSYNTAMGYGTLLGFEGSYNTAIGARAAGYYDLFNDIDNSTAIGYDADVWQSNQVRIGNVNVTSIGGQVGWTTFSDGRYKKNIKEDIKGLAFINKLRPVRYNVDIKSLKTYINKGKKQSGETVTDVDKATEEAAKITYDGFVAQEVEKAATELGFEFSGVDKPASKNGLYGLRYDNFVVPLVKAVQELSKENEALKKEYKESIADLQKQIDELKAARQNSIAPQPANNTSLTDASMGQNVPNPFASTTTIRYTLPKKFTTAQIVITDMKGRTIKQANLPAGRQGISGAGTGALNIEASMLPPGTYNYSLFVNGKLIEAKQMIVAK